MAWLRTWTGGRVRGDRHGREVWVIERIVGGDSYSITLDASSERGALAELALFERGPAAFRTKKLAAAENAGAAVRLTLEVVTRFLEELKRKNRVLAYRKNTRGHLSWWMRKLGERDLRTVRLGDLNRMLDTTGNRKGRIIALKSCCSYLRDRGELARADDPTMDLKVPKPVPERDLRKKGHTMDQAQRIYRALEHQVARDVMRLKWTTGMHLSEVDSLVLDGEIRPLPGYGQIAGILRFWHKGRKIHIQSVDAATLAAAQRLKERARVPTRNWLQEQLDAAAAAARVEPVAIGATRHSFVTWSKDHGAEVKPASGGVSLATIAAAIGHESSRTTRRFYDETEVPLMVHVPNLHLVHPDDPAQLAARVTEAR